jgi:ADP-heptose:LPS heptosyltransferase
VVVVFGPDEAEVREEFKELEGQHRVALWTSGSFLEAGALLRMARLFIGNDSGLCHLAAAVGTPVVTVFGPTRVSRWEPRGETVRLLSRQERCSYPCWPAVFDTPCRWRRHRCLTGIPVRSVFQAVSLILRLNATQSS